MAGGVPGLEVRPGRRSGPSWVLYMLPLFVYLSQRIQESCQSGTKWLVDTQMQARRRKRGVHKKGSGSPSHSLNQKNTRLSGATHLPLGLREWEHHRLPSHTGPRAHLLRRARREAAFWRSPYSSTEPLCSPRQVGLSHTCTHIHYMSPRTSDNLLRFPAAQGTPSCTCVWAQLCPQLQEDLRKSCRVLAFRAVNTSGELGSAPKQRMPRC